MDFVDFKYDDSTPVKTGEIYRFIYKYRFGIFKDFQKDAIISDIKKSNNHFEVTNSYISENSKEIIIDCVVKDNPLPFLAVFGILVLGTSSLLIIFNISVSKIQKLVESPSGSVAVASFSILSLLAAGIGTYLFFFKGKG